MEIKERIQPYMAKHYDGGAAGFYSPPKLKIDIPKSEDGKWVSENDYWENYYGHPDFNYEWNNGILEEKAVSNLKGYDLFDWFAGVIKQFLITSLQGRLVGLEIGFKLSLNNKKKTVRKPDLALIHIDNPVQMSPEDRTYAGCFDMCFEILSDSTKKAKENDTVVKKTEYNQFGVKEYYILDEKGKETAFYKLNKNGIYTKIRPFRGGIIKSSVLKGFQFRKEDLYLRPDLKDLINDPVYKNYVLLDYQKKCEEVEAAIKRADAEKKKANAERKRAEKAELKVQELLKRLQKYEEIK